MIFPLRKQDAGAGIRAGWFVITAFLVTSITIPGNRLADHVIRSAGPLHVEFATVIRAHHPTDLTIAIDPAARDNGKFEIWLDSTFLEHVRFEDVRPTPISSRLVDGNLTFQFAGRNDGQPDTVVFEIKQDALGNQNGSLGLVEGSQISFAQTVMP